MRIKPRSLVVLLAVVFAMVAAACGNGDEPAAEETTPATEAATTTEAPEVTTTTAAPEVTTTTAAPEETTTTPSALTEADLIDVGADPGSGEGIKIGYISLGDSIPFVKLVSDNIREQAEIAGAEFVFCDGEVDPTKSLECARTLGVQEVDVVINFNLFEDAAEEICEAYGNKPTISIDIHQTCETSFFGADNFRAGFMTGASTGLHIEANFDCEYDEFVLLNALAAGQVVIERGDGAVAGFEEICGEIPEDKFTLVDVPSIAVDEARVNFGDWLTTHPDAEVIAVASTNDDMFLGAIAATEAAGRDGQVFGTAQGADESSWVRVVCDESWVADTAYFPERYGRTTVPAAIAAAQGIAIPDPLFVNHIVLTNNPAILGTDLFPTAPFTDFYPDQTCG